MYLVINTAGRECQLGVYDGGKITERYLGASSDILSDTIFSAIKRIVPDASKLQGVGVVTGPGSYTGLRVGITCANGIGYGRQIPVCGVTLFQLYHEMHPDAQVIVLDNLHDLVYHDDLTTPVVETMNQFLSRKISGKVYGKLVDVKMNESAEKFEFCSLNDDPMKLMETLGTITAKEYQKSRVFNKSILPLYITPPNITKPKSR